MQCATCGQSTPNQPQLVDAVPAGMGGNHGMTAIPIYQAFCTRCLDRQRAISRVRAAAVAEDELRAIQANLDSAAAQHKVLDDTSTALHQVRELVRHLIAARPQGARKIIRDAWIDPPRSNILS